MDELQGRDLFLTRTCNLLEAMTNISYLVRQQPNVSRQTSVYHNMMDDQIVALIELVKAEVAANHTNGRIHRHEIKINST
jgi:hypothetical protein